MLKGKNPKPPPPPNIHFIKISEVNNKKIPVTAKPQRFLTVGETMVCCTETKYKLTQTENN